MSWCQVVGLVLIIEALLPFISPNRYRAMVTQIAAMSDPQVRWFALVLLMIGTGCVILAG